MKKLRRLNHSFNNLPGFNFSDLLFQNSKHCGLTGFLRDPFLIGLTKAHRRYRGGSFVFGCNCEQVRVAPKNMLEIFAGLLRDPFLIGLTKAHRRYRGGSFVFGCNCEQVRVAPKNMLEIFAGLLRDPFLLVLPKSPGRLSPSPGFFIVSNWQASLPFVPIKNPGAIAPGSLCPGLDSNQHILSNAAT